MAAAGPGEGVEAAFEQVIVALLAECSEIEKHKSKIESMSEILEFSGEKHREIIARAMERHQAAVASEEGRSRIEEEGGSGGFLNGQEEEPEGFLEEEEEEPEGIDQAQDDAGERVAAAGLLELRVRGQVRRSTRMNKGTAPKRYSPSTTP